MAYRSSARLIADADAVDFAWIDLGGVDVF